MRPVDTTEAAWSVMEDRVRRVSPGERVAHAVSLTVLAHSFALAGIRARYPHEDERQHRLRLASRFIEPDLMRRAFGWPDDGSR